MVNKTHVMSIVLKDLFVGFIGILYSVFGLSYFSKPPQRTQTTWNFTQNNQIGLMVMVANGIEIKQAGFLV